MFDKSFLRCFVVIRSYEQKSIHAEVSRFLRQFQSVDGVVTSSSRNHGNLFIDFFDTARNERRSFLVCQSRRFSRRSANDNGIGVPFENKIKYTVKRIKIE